MFNQYFRMSMQTNLNEQGGHSDFCTGETVQLYSDQNCQFLAHWLHFIYLALCWEAVWCQTQILVSQWPAVASGCFHSTHPSLVISHGSLSAVGSGLNLFQLGRILTHACLFHRWDSEDSDLLTKLNLDQMLCITWSALLFGPFQYFHVCYL